MQANGNFVIEKILKHKNNKLAVINQINRILIDNGYRSMKEKEDIFRSFMEAMQLLDLPDMEFYAEEVSDEFQPIIIQRVHAE